MESTQLLLTIILSISSLLLIVIGIQCILLLKELRKTVQHVSHIIEYFDSVGADLGPSLSEMGGFIQGIKTVFDIVVSTKHEKS